MAFNQLSKSTDLGDQIDGYIPPNRSDITFLWDAVNCNPNGDPLADDEPRRDRVTGEAFVSRYRINRYLRDQMNDDGHGILLKRPDQAGRQNPLDRPTAYRYIDEVTDLDTIEIAQELDEAEEAAEGAEEGDEELDDLLDARKRAAEYLARFFGEAMDVRTFGAPVSIGSNEGKDVTAIRSLLPRRITGPVQTQWASSMNTTELLTEGRKLTTVMSSGGDDDGGEKEQGTFGEAHRLKYAAFTVDATIDNRAARQTLFSDEDASYLDGALWQSLKDQTLSASKVGQEPRLYLRVEYSDGSHVGNLKRGLKIVNRDGRDDRELRQIDDWYLDASDLVAILDHDSVTDRIATVHLTVSEGLDVAVAADGSPVEDPGVGSGSRALVDAVHDVVGGDRLDSSVVL